MRGGEQWRDIPGYDGLYQVSNKGRVRTWRKKGHKGMAEKPVIMRQFTKGRSPSLVVGLRDPDTRAIRHFIVAQAVYLAFVGPIPEGRRVLHRTLNVEDNRPENLILGCVEDQTRRMNAMNKKNGSVRRKPVLKINRDLEIVSVYTSAREADRKNGFARSVIDDHCNLKFASVFARDGYIYAWDDDRWLAKTLRRAMAELDDLGIRYNDPFTSRYYDLPPEPELALEPAGDAGIPWEDAPALAGGGGRPRSPIVAFIDEVAIQTQ